MDLLGGIKALVPASLDFPCTQCAASPKEGFVHESLLFFGVGHLDKTSGRQNPGIRESSQPNPVVPNNQEEIPFELVVPKLV